MTSPASWHLDPRDPELVRYWDGTAWTDERRPALVHFAEQQVALTRRIADDVRVTKGWVTFLGVLALVGLVLGVLAVAGVVSSVPN